MGKQISGAREAKGERESLQKGREPTHLSNKTVRSSSHRGCCLFGREVVLAACSSSLHSVNSLMIVPREPYHFL